MAPEVYPAVIRKGVLMEVIKTTTSLTGEKINLVPSRTPKCAGCFFEENCPVSNHSRFMCFDREDDGPFFGIWRLADGETV